MAVNLPLSGFPKGTGVTPECEVSYEGGDDLEQLYNDCQTNTGHTSFVPVCDFQPSHLPEEYQTQETFKKVKDLCDLTVKILIKYISLERPETYADSDERYPYSGKMRGSTRVRRFGTGFVRSLDADGKKSHVQGERCPCADCKKSDSPKMEYWTLMVGTSTHVIFDDSEAACAVVECFFDSEDRDGVKTMYGVSLKPRSLEFNNHQSDSCYLNCVTHDKDLFNKLHELCCNYNFTFSMDRYASPLAYLISHPHGCSKRISLGQLLHITAPIDSEHPVRTPIMFEEGTVCRVPLYPWSWPDEENTVPFDDAALSRDSHAQHDNKVDPAGFQINEERPDDTKSRHKEQHDESSMKADESWSRESTEVGLIRGKDQIKRCDDPKSSDSDQTCLNKEKDPQKSTRDVDTNSDEKLSLASPGCHDYSHLGATSLSFQEILNLSATKSEDELNPERSQTREEKTDEEMTLASHQYVDFDEIAGAEFQSIPGFDFESLFGTGVLPPPPGAFIVLSPELDYYFNSSSSDPRAPEFCLQPGKECIIPFGTTFTLPASAKYAKRFPSLKPPWFTLPPGSKLTLPDGKDVRLPTEAEFLSDRMSLRFSYVTYDLSTCAGSSGAIVHQEGVTMGLPFSVYNFSHFGTMTDGYKRSGLQNLFLCL